MIKQQKGRELNRIQCAHLGVKQLAKGTNYEDLIEQFPELPTVVEEETDEDEIEDEEEPDLEPFETPLDPLAEAYIEKVLGTPHPSTLPLYAPTETDYFEKMEGKYDIQVQ